jgi:type IV pilus assembly protein PilQ
MKIRLYITYLVLLMTSVAYGQNYNEQQVRSILDSLGQKHKGYNNAVQLNVTGLALSELINSMALENNLNLSVDPGLSQLISYNFFDAQVKDVLVFVYQNFDVEYRFIGSILSVQKRAKDQPKQPVFAPKTPEMAYNASNTFLSYDLKADTLWRVAEQITKLTGKNFVVSPDVRNKQINGFVQNRPLEQSLEMLAKANLITIKKEDDYFYVGPADPEMSAPVGKGNSSKAPLKTDNFSIILNPEGNLDVSASNADLASVIISAAAEKGIHYVFYTIPEGKTSLELKNVTIDQLLQHLLSNTKYSFSKDKELYLIGEQKQEGVRQSTLIRLENRTIESVKTALPKELTAELEISEFVELNGLIVTGTDRRIEELRRFIGQIDVVVPMVQIDVMLLYSKTGSSTKTGIKAGLKNTPTQTQGDVFPGLDMQLGSQTINDLLNAISGFGIVNLGQVTENFYVSLQALESNNIISIESTPKVSTLNGHEASISIGETTYYQETQVNVQTSVTNQGVLQSRMWKSIDANLSVKIKPFVSADEHVTLTIKVEQDDFSGKIDPSSPPNISTQNFESLVRVKNGEVILLGGLEKKKKNDSGSGVPLLSRIPILKWFFSSRVKEREKSKLHILIRPTVTY